MPKVRKTQRNPHGLTNKQKLVIEDMIDKVENGNPMTPVNSTKKFYDVKNDNSANSMTSQNFAKSNFRKALLSGLRKRKIIGQDSIVESKLTEGLDATKRYRDEDIPDYSTRLNYIQEIHKIAGVYAPERRETKSMILKADISEEELDAKIKNLQNELDG